MKKKFLATLLIGALSLTGCSTDNNMAKTVQKDELTISVGRNMVAGKFDPTVGYGVWHPDIFHSHILTVGKDNKLVNDLATKETISDDGLTYTYEIRKDAKFTDGKMLTAKDIVFTFNKTKERASAADLSMLDSVEAKDDYTVVFHLKKPWSTFPYSLLKSVLYLLMHTQIPMVINLLDPAHGKCWISKRISSLFLPRMNITMVKSLPLKKSPF